MCKLLTSVTILSAAAALGGCSAASMQPAGSALPSAGAALSRLAPSAHKATPVVFIPNLSDEVAYYSANIRKSSQELGEITNGITRSQADWVDSRQTLYVLNSEPYPSIEEYRPGDTQAFKSITTDLYEPAAVAVDKHATVYVDDRDSGGPVVYEYAHGSTSPTKTISLPAIGRAEYQSVAIDPKGNFYVGAFNEESQESYLVEIPAGSSQAKNVTPAGFPGSAIAFDGEGNLYSCSESGYVDVYPPGFKRVSYSIDVSDAEVFGGITVTANGTLYVPSYTGQLFEIAPKAKAPTNSFGVVEGAFDAAVGSL